MKTVKEACINLWRSQFLFIYNSIFFICMAESIHFPWHVLFMPRSIRANISWTHVKISIILYIRVLFFSITLYFFISASSSFNRDSVQAFRPVLIVAKLMVLRICWLGRYPRWDELDKNSGNYVSFCQLYTLPKLLKILDYLPLNGTPIFTIFRVKLVQIY